MPTVLYGSEKLTLYEYDKSRRRDVGMNFLRRSCGIRKIDTIRNEVVRNLCGVEKGMDECVEMCVYLAGGHVRIN